MGEKRKDHGTGLWNEILISKWADAGYPGMDNGVDGTNRPEVVAKGIRKFVRDGHVKEDQYKFARMVYTKYSEWMKEHGLEYSPAPQALVNKLNLKEPA